MSNFGLMAFAAVLALGFSVPANAQQSYRAICNSGTGMSAVAQPGGNLRVNFRPGNQAANAGEGMCTWLDRGFRAGEPGVLLVSGNGQFAQYIVNHVLAGDVFYVDIYNNGNGAMIVTRVGL